jgi:hypothetical protein
LELVFRLPVLAASSGFGLPNFQKQWAPDPGSFRRYASAAKQDFDVYVLWACTCKLAKVT